jgi:hypothetical protein
MDQLVKEVVTREDRQKQVEVGKVLFRQLQFESLGQIVVHKASL